MDHDMLETAVYRLTTDVWELKNSLKDQRASLRSTLFVVVILAVIQTVSCFPEG
jgi:hypothetical protein